MSLERSQCPFPPHTSKYYFTQDEFKRQFNTISAYSQVFNSVIYSSGSQTILTREPFRTHLCLAEPQLHPRFVLSMGSPKLCFFHLCLRCLHSMDRLWNKDITAWKHKLSFWSKKILNLYLMWWIKLFFLNCFEFGLHVWELNMEIQSGRLS